MSGDKLALGAAAALAAAAMLTQRGSRAVAFDPRQGQVSFSIRTEEDLINDNIPDGAADIQAWRPILLHIAKTYKTQDFLKLDALPTELLGKIQKVKGKLALGHGLRFEFEELVGDREIDLVRALQAMHLRALEKDEDESSGPWSAQRSSISAQRLLECEWLAVKHLQALGIGRITAWGHDNYSGDLDCSTYPDSIEATLDLTKILDLYDLETGGDEDYNIDASVFCTAQEWQIFPEGLNGKPSMPLRVWKNNLRRSIAGTYRLSAHE